MDCAETLMVSQIHSAPRQPLTIVRLSGAPAPHPQVLGCPASHLQVLGCPCPPPPGTQLPLPLPPPRCSR